MMRIIFSRKGFDSASGGCASPIIDGEPVSLPIPQGNWPSATRYSQLSGEYSSLIADLGRGVKAGDFCHLDPDIKECVLPRSEGWRATFGQADQAQTHLHNQGVSTGDIFLFFGLFRSVQRNGTGRWRFVGPSEHRIFGWLQIGEIEHLGSDGSQILKSKPWLVDHPHARAGCSRINTIYIATETLSLPGMSKSDLPGAGTFRNGYRLSAFLGRPSQWRVPNWLHPKMGGVGMSFHPDANRWMEGGLVQTVGRGQEFVATINCREDALLWLNDVFKDPKAN